MRVQSLVATMTVAWLCAVPESGATPQQVTKDPVPGITNLARL